MNVGMWVPAIAPVVPGSVLPMLCVIVIPVTPMMLLVTVSIVSRVFFIFFVLLLCTILYHLVFACLTRLVVLSWFVWLGVLRLQWLVFCRVSLRRSLSSSQGLGLLFLLLSFSSPSCFLVFNDFPFSKAFFACALECDFSFSCFFVVDCYRCFLALSGICW